MKNIMLIGLLYTLGVLVYGNCSAMIDPKQPDTDTYTDTDTETYADSDTDSDTYTDTDTDTGPACTGTGYEGGCWFLSGIGDHCENRCEDHGAEFDPYTCDYAGDVGDPDKCRSVLEAIEPGIVINDVITGSGPYGCIYWDSIKQMGLYDGCTDDGGGGNAQRICACTF